MWQATTSWSWLAIFDNSGSGLVPFKWAFKSPLELERKTAIWKKKYFVILARSKFSWIWVWDFLSLFHKQRFCCHLTLSLSLTLSPLSLSHSLSDSLSLSHTHLVSNSSCRAYLAAHTRTLFFRHTNLAWGRERDTIKRLHRQSNFSDYSCYEIAK